MASTATKGWGWASVWTLVTVVCGVAAAVVGGKTGVPLVFAAIALGLLTFPYMAFAFTPVASAAEGWLAARPGRVVWLVAFFVGVYLIYGVGTGTFDIVALVRVALFAGIPTALAVSARDRPPGCWQDAAAILCIWLPFNLQGVWPAVASLWNVQLTAGFGLLSQIWAWPEGEAAYVLNTPLAIDLALVLFLCVRRFRDLHFQFKVRRQDLPLVAACLVGFIAIALPIGLGTGFITWNPQLVARKIVQPLAIFFFIAVPEELLFRGLAQGLLLKRTGKPVVAIVLASLFFGASHWHNVGMPDFRYLGLASIAGLFYGYTYYRSGNIAVCALLHAAVDTLWDLFLHT